MLRARGLVKSYPLGAGAALPVLVGVDIDVQAGELALITGPSGSGKSTLLNLLGLLEEPEAGDVWYGGERLTAAGRSARSRARGRSVGFMFQSFLLLSSLTALENVLLAARYVGREDPPSRRRALDLLAEVGVADRAEHYPPELSGGEQQRVAFCRAVFNDPPLLLADEPTGNLDDANGAVILTKLRARAEAGAAVVVVSHRHDVAQIATRVLRLSAGRIERAAETNPPER
jgi:putative ABC transport system ATP-binding protein